LTIKRCFRVSVTSYSWKAAKLEIILKHKQSLFYYWVDVKTTLSNEKLGTVSTRVSKNSSYFRKQLIDMK